MAARPQQESPETRRSPRVTRLLVIAFAIAFALTLLLSACAAHDLVRGLRFAHGDQQAHGLTFQAVGRWCADRLPESRGTLLGLPEPTYLGPALAFIAAWPLSALAALALALVLRRRAPRGRRLFAGASALASVLLVLDAICAVTVWRQQFRADEEARPGELSPLHISERMR